MICGQCKEIGLSLATGPGFQVFDWLIGWSQRVVHSALGPWPSSVASALLAALHAGLVVHVGTVL